MLIQTSGSPLRRCSVTSMDTGIGGSHSNCAPVTIVPITSAFSASCRPCCSNQLPIVDRGSSRSRMRFLGRGTRISEPASSRPDRINSG